jgi:peptidoglycan/LPS O-acetylase OafA/YrhL
MLARIKQWTVPTSTASHLDVLDGLRGVAIILVVSFHAFYTNPEHGSIARAVGYMLSWGKIGVPIFFVLSGFLISYPFFKSKSGGLHSWYPEGYARRRIAKILPPFYLSIVLIALFYWFRFHDTAYVKAGLKWAIGLGHFVPISPEFNTPYWSLLVEVSFYLTLPFLFWLTRNWQTRTTTIVIALLLLFVPFAVRQLNWPGGLTVYPDVSTPLGARMDFAAKQFPCLLDYFGWGVAFAAVYALLIPQNETLRPLSLFGYLGASLLLGTIVLLSIWSATDGILTNATRWSEEAYHWLPGLSGFLLLFFIFDSNCAGSRLLSSTWLRFTGLISYEWFLFHYPIILWFKQLFGSTHGNILSYLLKTAVPLVVTFAFSVAVYRWFSLPLLNRIRGIPPPKKQPICP